MVRPIASTSTPAAWARAEEGQQAIVGDGGDVDALILGEIAGMAERRRAVDQRADIAGQRHFGERDGEAAVGDVVAGGDRAAGDRGADEVAGGALVVQVDRRRRAGVGPSRPCISRSQSDWPRWPWRSPIVTMTSPVPLKAMPTAFVQSSIRPTPPIAGVGRMAWLELPSSALVSL